MIYFWNIVVIICVAFLSGTAGYIYARNKYGKIFAEQMENMKEWYRNPENRGRDV
tara:strand:+ start:1186 stop:1350 length:165 start_codon:yes stop_codon:yes gene_type:complete